MLEYGVLFYVDLKENCVSSLLISKFASIFSPYIELMNNQMGCKTLECFIIYTQFHFEVDTEALAAKSNYGKFFDESNCWK